MEIRPARGLMPMKESIIIGGVVAGTIVIAYVTFIYIRDRRREKTARQIEQQYSQNVEEANIESFTQPQRPDSRRQRNQPPAYTIQEPPPSYKPVHREHKPKSKELDRLKRRLDKLKSARDTDGDANSLDRVIREADIRSLHHWIRRREEKRRQEKAKPLALTRWVGAAMTAREDGIAKVSQSRRGSHASQSCCAGAGPTRTSSRRVAHHQQQQDDELREVVSVPRRAARSDEVGVLLNGEPALPHEGRR